MLHDSQLPKFLWAEATKHVVYLKNHTWTHALGDTTPFEILIKKKPNLANLYSWGCHVRVHEETGNGHRVYWAKKWSITVERSVRFNFEEEVVVGQLPLKGENSTSKPKTSQTAPIKTTTIEEVVEPAVGAEVPEVPDHLGEGFKDEQPAEG